MTRVSTIGGENGTRDHTSRGLSSKTGRNPYQKDPGGSCTTSSRRNEENKDFKETCLQRKKTQYKEKVESHASRSRLTTVSSVEILREDAATGAYVTSV